MPRYPADKHNPPSVLFLSGSTRTIPPRWFIGPYLSHRPWCGLPLGSPPRARGVVGEFPRAPRRRGCPAYCLSAGYRVISRVRIPDLYTVLFYCCSSTLTSRLSSIPHIVGLSHSCKRQSTCLTVNGGSIS